MKLHCHKCNELVDVDMKMGGLICELCRTIIALPNSDIYKKYREQMMLEYAKGDGDE